MAPLLITEGKIQILGETHNSVVYAVAGDTETGLAKDSLSVLKGGTVWYEGREALGPKKEAKHSDKVARQEAAIYTALGRHDRILGFLGLEIAASVAWAIRLERALGSLRDCITTTNLPEKQTRLQLATQFAEGVVHIHQCGIIWGDLSTRNALLFDQWRIKLGDFADSDLMDKYGSDWYGCEIRYCPPGSDWLQLHKIGTTMERELFALGTAICEIVEWRVPYGPESEVSQDEVIAVLLKGQWPEITCGNPAEDVIRRCWAYQYKSSEQVVADLQAIYAQSGSSTACFR